MKIETAKERAEYYQQALKEIRDTFPVHQAEIVGHGDTLVHLTGRAHTFFQQPEKNERIGVASKH